MKTVDLAHPEDHAVATGAYIPENPTALLSFT